MVVSAAVTDGSLRPHVRVFHPYDRRPLPGVEVTATVEDHDFAATATTDERGEAEIVLPVPEDFDYDGFTVVAVARYRGQEREAEAWAFAELGAPRVILGTDKKLYQPGQRLYVRGLWLGHDGRPLAEQAVKLALEDARGRVVFFAELVTSPFGVAATEWRIPPTAEEGRYTIEAGFPPILYAGTSVDVSRYELPRLRIARAETSKRFYLTGEDADIEVEVTTPAGEPIAGAEVGLRQNARGYSTWDDETLALARARTDDSGRAVLHLPFAADEDPVEYYDRPYLDHALTVTARDTVSGRSATAPVTIRVSRSPIHVYLVGDLPLPGLPSKTFVTTSTAEGEPVACEVEIRLRSAGQGEIPLGRLVTDQHGLGRVELAVDLRDEGGDLLITARDAAGRSGHLELDYWDALPEPALGIGSPRSLYKPGQPLEVTVHVTEPMDDVVVEVRRGARLLRKRRPGRVAGPARLVFNADADFHGRLDIVAYSLSPEHAGNEPPAGQRSVLYPSARSLGLEVTADRHTYRPGDQARLSVETSMPAAIGVAVTDASLEALQVERGWSVRPGLLSYLDESWTWDEYSGWTVERLLNLEPDEDLTDDLDRLAEFLVRHDAAYISSDFSTPLGEEHWEFRSFFGSQFLGWRYAFDNAFRPPSYLIPKDAPEAFAILAAAGLDANSASDPWGTPYRASLSPRRGRWILELESAGRDRAWDSIDDFVAWSYRWAYARRLGDAVERVERRWFEETGDFLREPADLLRELDRDGTDWAAERDPSDRSYRIEVAASQGRYYRLDILSSEPNEVVWTVSLDVVELRAALLREALGEHRERTGSLPGSDDDVRRALERIGQDPDRWRDAEGRPLYFEVQEELRYVDRQVVTPEGESRLEPLTVTVGECHLWSVGPDLVRGTEDDLRLGQVEPPTPELWEEPRPEKGNGVLRGTVFDPSGYALPGTTVAVIDVMGRDRLAISDSAGQFVFSLPAGVYTVRVSLEGFTMTEHTRVELHAGKGTGLDVILVPLEAEEIVVTSEAPAVHSPRRAATAAPPVRTPRVRRDFRETLLWLPEVATGADGRAEVTVDLDDSITTWRLAAFASTRDGRLSTATRTLVSTLPFQAELDLPPVLTAGDAIAVPVYLHNRTGKEQRVEVAAELRTPGPSASTDAREATLAAEEVRRLDFQRRFSVPGESVLSVVASGPGASDAVERRTHVRPDGRERMTVAAWLVTGTEELELEVPADALPGTGQLEVRVMKSMSDHLETALEGLARRPTGCAEQILSTAWASAVRLRRLVADGKSDTEAARLARERLEAGRDALLHFRIRDGGVAYWPDGQADVALTAHALEYLREVENLIPVDPELPRGLAAWLARVQGEDGSWRRRRPPLRYSEAGTLSPGLLDLRVTAWVARVLASTEHSEPARRALALLAENRVVNDPYSLANEVLAREHLAALHGDPRPLAERRELRALARDLEGTSYWHLESNSPFHGWGDAGRIEATALAVRALHADGRPETDDIVERGIAFLLLHKDVYGIWGSTQATIQALRAISGVMSSGSAPAAPLAATLDGDAVSLRPWQRFDAPLAVGRHRLRLESREGGLRRVVEARIRYHVPWQPREDSEDADLALDVSCDPKEGLLVEQTVTCAVEVERRRWRGYGMLIAEIGLPPGAEVEKQSLDAAVTDAAIQSYEIWPDRVVAYLWPRAGGVRFGLSWRPRLAMNARSAASSLYDYYNPSARVVLPPDDYRVDR